MTRSSLWAKARMVRLCPRRMTRARYLPLNTTWKVIGYSIDPLKNISLLNQVVTKKTLKGSSANFFRTFNGLRLTFQVVSFIFSAISPVDESGESAELP